ncbi:hypothetical protein [Sulfurospirillum sp. MES]|uniref:hypothetical protein n=1 Tax=Sulfurospirillum TaxID=57665 RepID=UPI0005430958|nr:hypothetical protein [Sulfurospirillum sp. MES]KHG34112.1 MAG: hypothetical protein OA34_07170 [Sulfurospirillum sp. MES]
MPPKVIFPEVYSFEESIAILNKYKNQLTKEQYENTKSVIGNHAIESIYLNERDIKILVDMDVHHLSSEEAIQRARERGEF